MKFCLGYFYRSATALSVLLLASCSSSAKNAPIISDYQVTVATEGHKVDADNKDLVRRIFIGPKALAKIEFEGLVLENVSGQSGFVTVPKQSKKNLSLLGLEVGDKIQYISGKFPFDQNGLQKLASLLISQGRAELQIVRDGSHRKIIYLLDK